MVAALFPSLSLLGGGGGPPLRGRVAGKRTNFTYSHGESRVTCLYRARHNHSRGEPPEMVGGITQRAIRARRREIQRRPWSGVRLQSTQWRGMEREGKGREERGLVSLPASKLVIRTIIDE
ncbi:hypothetical protein BO70DRAFT_119226 [Aspergillus heteromorphus CBS 117.55]|uniref:Uncharacterized protein n=1 Tax=Aspergillus heteromorphus CBS 117.55 TaxID=1448321 RepID=A0A317VB82_9EURO|nr:uncharacterized protein BO70DRAFT_119226 [Aspergillus heteromorphus CBS 117.55]PWY71614.1 hypothetical protein BO70DRAFT_119226 [Aspergillus heteromorphus CBS 117.55]